MLVVISIARAYALNDFGKFAVSYSILTLLLAVTRSYFGTRISMSLSPQTSLTMVSHFLGMGIIFSPIIIGATYTLSSLLVGGGSVLILVVSIATPLVILQDLVRYAAVSSGRAWVALISDLLWVLVVALIFLLPAAPSPALLSLWLAAVGIALATGMIALRLKPQFRGSLKPTLKWDSLAGSMAGGSLLAQGSNVIIITLASVLLGPAASAALRGASTLIGPVNVVFAYMNISVTPLLVRRSRAHDFSFALKSSIAVTIVALALGSTLWLIPDSWGQALLGETWEISSGIIPAITAEYMALAFGCGAILVLKVRRQSVALFWQKLVTAMLAVTLAGIGAVVGQDVLWVSLGLAGGAIIGAIISWSCAIRARKDKCDNE